MKKHKKWWRVLFDDIFQTIIVNIAWKFYNIASYKQVSHKKFIEYLLDEIYADCTNYFFVTMLNASQIFKYKLALSHQLQLTEVAKDGICTHCNKRK